MKTFARGSGKFLWGGDILTETWIKWGSEQGSYLGAKDSKQKVQVYKIPEVGAITGGPCASGRGSKESRRWTPRYLRCMREKGQIMCCLLHFIPSKMEAHWRIWARQLLDVWATDGKRKEIVWCGHKRRSRESSYKRTVQFQMRDHGGLE